MIGVYGGTFDPVHYGHLRTALEVKQVFSLDELRFIPCARPAHREQPQTGAEHRLRMLELALLERDGFCVDRRELDRSGPSYMVDTLKSIRAEIEQQALLLFIGTDAFKHLTGWHRWQQLFDYAHVVVMTRPGFDQQKLEGFFKQRRVDDRQFLRRQASGLLFFQTVTQLDISATQIRQIIAEAKDPGFLLPDRVIEYIQKNSLYISKDI